MALFFALLVTAFAVTSVLRLRPEERTGHTEAALATAVSRRRGYFSWLGFTTLASAVLLLISGLGVRIGAAAGNAGACTLLEVTVATLVYLPAVMVVAGMAAALFGIRPAVPIEAWSVVAYCSAPSWTSPTSSPIGRRSPTPHRCHSRTCRRRR